jgi:hypothetical protein
MKVRGPTKDSSNLIYLDNTRCPGTLTLTLSRGYAGEGNTWPGEKNASRHQGGTFIRLGVGG